jgi:hypothetical protein
MNCQPQEVGVESIDGAPAGRDVILVGGADEQLVN